VEALCAACPDPDAVAEFRRQLSRARKVMTVLDLHKHYIDQMAFGHVRHAMAAAARWLVARGILAAEEDVFWLRFEEIGAALRDPPASPLEATISARREQHARWAALEAPSLLGVPGATPHLIVDQVAHGPVGRAHHFVPPKPPIVQARLADQNRVLGAEIVAFQAKGVDSLWFL
jgi:hypothetical protein